MRSIIEEINDETNEGEQECGDKKCNVKTPHKFNYDILKVSII